MRLQAQDMAWRRNHAVVASSVREISYNGRGTSSQNRAEAGLTVKQQFYDFVARPQRFDISKEIEATKVHFIISPILEI